MKNSSKTEFMQIYIYLFMIMFAKQYLAKLDFKENVYILFLNTFVASNFVTPIRFPKEKFIADTRNFT